MRGLESEIPSPFVEPFSDFVPAMARRLELGPYWL
jgi:hypothetical protein